MDEDDDRRVGACGKCCAVVDECEARGDVIRALRAENARLLGALNNIEAYVDGRVIAHRDIAEMAESSASGKKQRVRLSEASDILGKIRAARAAMGESDETHKPTQV